jgi:hypothetical protein
MFGNDDKIKFAFTNMLKSTISYRSVHYHSVRILGYPIYLKNAEIKNKGLSCLLFCMVEELVSHLKGRTRLGLSENRQLRTRDP